MSLMSLMSGCTHMHSLQLPNPNARRPFRAHCHPEPREGPFAFSAPNHANTVIDHRASIGASPPTPYYGRY